MRVWIKGMGTALLSLFVASQLIPVDRRNPPVERARTLYEVQPVPAGVRQVFERSCQNCHSNETAWPWYSYVAPVSWLVAHDVHQARRTMNFSEWGSYSAAKKEEKLEEICEQVTNGDMPDRKYALFHRNARPSSADRAAVCDWTEEAREY